MIVMRPDICASALTDGYTVAFEYRAANPPQERACRLVQMAAVLACRQAGAHVAAGVVFPLQHWFFVLHYHGR
jgi:hypothetical protein